MQSGVEKLPNLRVLYASNNKLSSWADLDKVNQLPKLEELLLAGNPLYNDYRDRGALAEYRVEVRLRACVRVLQLREACQALPQAACGLQLTNMCAHHHQQSHRGMRRHRSLRATQEAQSCSACR